VTVAVVTVRQVPLELLVMAVPAVPALPVMPLPLPLLTVLLPTVPVLALAGLTAAWFAAWPLAVSVLWLVVVKRATTLAATLMVAACSKAPVMAYLTASLRQ
jgi:hypothetical protein